MVQCLTPLPNICKTLPPWMRVFHAVKVWLRFTVYSSCTSFFCPPSILFSLLACGLFASRTSASQLLSMYGFNKVEISLALFPKGKAGVANCQFSTQWKHTIPLILQETDWANGPGSTVTATSSCQYCLSQSYFLSFFCSSCSTF